MTWERNGYLPQGNGAVWANNDQVQCISFQGGSQEHQPHCPIDQPEIPVQYLAWALTVRSNIKKEEGEQDETHFRPNISLDRMIIAVKTTKKGVKQRNDQ